MMKAMIKAVKSKIEDPAGPSGEVVPEGLNGPFKALGLQGLTALAPVLVAALATEEPLEGRIR